MKPRCAVAMAKDAIVGWLSTPKIARVVLVSEDDGEQVSPIGLISAVAEKIERDRSKRDQEWMEAIELVTNPHPGHMRLIAAQMGIKIESGGIP